MIPVGQSCVVGKTIIGSMGLLVESGTPSPVPHFPLRKPANRGQQAPAAEAVSKQDIPEGR